MKTAMSLEDQIKRLHEELEVVIAAYVDERTAQAPGVPSRLLKMQLKWALASGWRCLRV
jgi:hypothetical protein